MIPRWPPGQVRPSGWTGPGRAVDQGAARRSASGTTGPGSRAPARSARACRSAALARGWAPIFLPTTREDHGEGLARHAVTAGAELVFAVGGDGTVRACASVLAGTGVRLAIVPRGTGNLAARALRVA